mgnify:CR=1 FL=1
MPNAYSSEELLTRWENQREIKNIMVRMVSQDYLFRRENKAYETYWSKAEDVCLGVNNGYYKGAAAVQRYFQGIEEQTKLESALIQKKYPTRLGDKSEEEKRIDERFAALEPILGDKIYSHTDDTLQNAIGTLLRGTGKTLSAAESCTGGMISSLITSVPGASEYYLGSVISYAVSVKENVLDVPQEYVSRYGVVSSEVAGAMAEGVRKLTGSSYSVATTGLAGPGGDEMNPVGTVWIGVSGPNGTSTAKRVYKNDRKRNIERFTSAALDELRLFILKDIKKGK